MRFFGLATDVNDRIPEKGSAAKDVEPEIETSAPVKPRPIVEKHSVQETPAEAV